MLNAMQCYWVAVYDDGTEIKQYDGSSEEILTAIDDNNKRMLEAIADGATDEDEKYQTLNKEAMDLRDKVTDSANIDREKLREFKFYVNNKLYITLSFEPDCKRKLIYRKRNYLKVGSAESQGFLYMLGWHQVIKGISKKFILYLYSDGTMRLGEASSDVELLPQEHFYYCEMMLVGEQ